MNTLPSKAEIIAWIADNPGQTAKRDVARAFGIKGAARIELKKLLKELKAEGLVGAERPGGRGQDATLPPVSVLEVLEPEADGEVFARPADWQGDGAPPRILILQSGADGAPGRGERILARLAPSSDPEVDFHARIIRRIGTSPRRVLGLYRATEAGGRILPIDRGQNTEWRVRSADAHGARDGELVEAEAAGDWRGSGLPAARIIGRLGDPGAPRAVSLIAIHQHGIPDRFGDGALAEAEAAQPAPLGAREDLRGLDLITIDPVDARDRDDAVLAQADTDPGNPGGHIVWVAIADVAHYVRPGTALDREARARGNSTYFPDRVVPMLPDRLSGDLCSLHQDVDRACLAVRMVLNAAGDKIAHRFARGLMRSRASLNYRAVQDAMDGRPDAATAPILDSVIRPLFAAFAAAASARVRRQPLELDLPERKILLDAEGRVSSVAFQERLEAHRLIEEFMILANVAAAEELTRRRQPLLFRVHEEPPPEKLEALREVAEASGMTLARGQVLQTRHLNSLLSQAQDTEFDQLINLTTLRSMTQAYYNDENFGHFGLALRQYAHFTSPIRRYSDLIVHRALIAAHGWGDDGLGPQDIGMLEETARHISETERRSMAAERDTTDRYLAAYMSERVGAELGGRVSGIARFGVFVRLDETGADGLVPVRNLGREYFRFDQREQALVGSETGLTLRLGQKVTARLVEAVPVTGGLILDLVAIEGAGMPAPRRPGRGKAAPRRKQSAAARKAQKLRRKVERKRK